MELKNKYIKSFDGIRVIALLGVVFYHLSQQTFKGGYLGVVIFFVLAGYLSTEKAFSEGEIKKNRPSKILSISIKKILKLQLPLLIVLSIVTLACFFLFKSQLISLNQGIKGAIFSLSNYFEIFSGNSYFENTGSLNPFKHLWALSLEIQFYILFFILFHGKYNAEKKLKYFSVFTILLISSFLYSNILILMGKDFSTVYYSLFTRLYSFIAGIMASFLSNSAKNNKENLPKLLSNNTREVLSFILLILTIIPFFTLDADMFTFKIGLFLYTILIAIFLIILKQENTFISKVFSIKFFDYFVKRSYDIFLWHFPIIAILERFIIKYKVSNIAYYFLFFILCISLSEFSYRLVKIISKYNDKFKFLVILILSIILLSIPYEKISNNTNEKKAMLEMQT